MLPEDTAIKWKSRGNNDPSEKDLAGRGEKVKTSMMHFLKHPEDHVFFLDIFFSSLRLITVFAQNGIARYEK